MPSNFEIDQKQEVVKKSKSVVADASQTNKPRILNYLMKKFESPILSPHVSLKISQSPINFRNSVERLQSTIFDGDS